MVEGPFPLQVRHHEMMQPMGGGGASSSLHAQLAYVCAFRLALPTGLRILREEHLALQTARRLPAPRLSPVTTSVVISSSSAVPTGR